MSDGIQLYPFRDGSIKPCNGWSAPSRSIQADILGEAFAGYQNERHTDEGAQGAIKKVRLYEGDKSRLVYYSVRAVSGGGRPATRPNELRVQIDPNDANELARINIDGGNAFLIGVYKNDDAEALAVWKPAQQTEAGGSVSKQVSCETVADALVNGISKQTYPNGDTTVFVINPKLFRGLINVIADLSGSPKVQPSQASEERVERNLVYFGAPGTGKSYNLHERVKREFDEDKVRRVTFHPDYTYAQFVGSFKPYSDINNGNAISYRYVTGAFMDTYLDAITHPDSSFVLIIEELNRANPAAVFGNVFQLLDRDAFGNSEYAVATSKEMADSIGAYFDNLSQDEKNAIESHYDDVGYEGIRTMSMLHLSIPDNMYIWATMNSADQGVYPMDTAFKRRWDFKYLGIDEGESIVQDYIVPIGNTGKFVPWNELRKAINDKLLGAKVNEDKLIGHYFIPPAVLASSEIFNDVFKSKVLLYLYEDAVKTKRSTFFKDGSATYSQICASYDKDGVDGIFTNMHLPYVEDADAEDSEAIAEDAGE